MRDIGLTKDIGLTNIKFTIILIIFIFPLPVHAFIIDFEDLETAGYGGSGHVRVSNQYSPMGIEFNGPIAVDFSKDIVISGFAHSGSKAIEQCYIGHCYIPIDIKFDPAVSSAGVWVGYHTSASGGFSQQREIDLIAYDQNELEITRSTAILNPRIGPMPIDILLKVKSLAANISHVQVTFRSVGYLLADNRGLVLDDVEFLRDTNNQTEIGNLSPIGNLTSTQFEMYSSSGSTPLFPALLTTEALIAGMSSSMDNAKVLFNTGNNLYDDKKYDKALSYYGKAMNKLDDMKSELDEARANLWYSEGNAYYMNKDYDSALKAYNNSLRLNSKHTLALYYKSVLLERNQNR